MSDNLIDMRSSHVDIMGLNALIDDIKKDDMTLLEIGCYRGQGTQILLNTNKVRKCFCVDPWTAGYDDNDLASASNMDAVERDFDNRILCGKWDVVKIKGTVDDFISGYPDQKIDLVYIDACHTYECTVDIIRKCLAHIKPSVISGHDYHPVWPDVVKVVDEFFTKPDIVYCDGSWLKYL